MYGCFCIDFCIKKRYTRARKFTFSPVHFGGAMSTPAYPDPTETVRRLAAVHTTTEALEGALRKTYPDASVVRADIFLIRGTSQRIVNVTLSGPRLYWGSTLRVE